MQEALAAISPPTLVRKLGMVSSSFATIQIDLNVVHRSADTQGGEISLCDHNCTTAAAGQPTGGRYTCPAAMSLNKGARNTRPAPTSLLTEGLLTTVEGIAEAQRRFLADDLDAYMARESVPPSLRPAFAGELARQRIAVNLFGGSPETHPGVLEIMTTLQRRGVEVHLTTTGRRILRDRAFRDRFLQSPPDLIGLGADDFESPDDIDHLFRMDFDELTTLWRRTPWQHGQRRKAIEAVQICKLSTLSDFPQILFNFVLHAGNLPFVERMLDNLSRYTGGRAILNPYPVQSAFMNGAGELGGAALDQLSAFVDEAISAHLARAGDRHPRWNLTNRFPYWMLLRALLDQAASPRLISDQVGGDGVWRCYARRGAGRCVQVGAGLPHGGISTDPYGGRSAHPGGHLGCFWNADTITDQRQFWTLDSAAVADWILDGRQLAARQSERPCRGCLFPRMSTDGVSLELGLSAPAAERYRAVRRHYLGY
jgi:hypothetical protein